MKSSVSTSVAVIVVGIIVIASIAGVILATSASTHTITETVMQASTSSVTSAFTLNRVTSTNSLVTTSSQSGPQVSIIDFAFSPSTITVVMGVNNTVTWTNNDVAAHTVTATGGSFDSGNLNTGQSWTHTFTTTGTFAYECSYHIWMTGTVIVETG